MDKIMKITIAVSIRNAQYDNKWGGTEAADVAMLNRVLDAVMPHPDSIIATEAAGEMITVLVTDWEVTS